MVISSLPNGSRWHKISVRVLHLTAVAVLRRTGTGKCMENLEKAVAGDMR